MLPIFWRLLRAAAYVLLVVSAVIAGLQGNYAKGSFALLFVIVFALQDIHDAITGE